MKEQKKDVSQLIKDLNPSILLDMDDEIRFNITLGEAKKDKYYIYMKETLDQVEPGLRKIIHLAEKIQKHLLEWI